MYRSRRVFVLLGVGSISVLLSFQVCQNVFAQSEPEKDRTASVQNAGKPQPGPDAMKDRILGDFHMGRGEYDDAIAAYREGVKADPSNTVLRYKLDRSIETCKKENAALNEGFTCGVGNPARPTPISTATRIARGDFYLQRGEYDDAIALYEEALKMDPSNAEIRYKLNRAVDTCKKENAALNKGLSCGAGGSVVPPMGGSGRDRIAGIIVRGNVRIPAPKLRKSISIFPGDIYDPAKIDRDVAALNKTGYF